MVMGSEERENKRYINKAEFKKERDAIFEELSVLLSETLTVSLTTSLSAALTTELSNSLLPIITKTIADKINEITSTALEIEHVANENASNIITIQSDILELKQASLEQKNIIDSLLVTNADLENKLALFENEKTQERIDDLSELIEERTNRQLRQTLVVKGLREKKNETWEETTSLLAKTFSNVLPNCSYNDAFEMINRAHRGAPNDRKVNMRDIYVNMSYWSDCEEIVEAFRTANVRENNFGIHV